MPLGSLAARVKRCRTPLSRSLQRLALFALCLTAGMARAQAVDLTEAKLGGVSICTMSVTMLKSLLGNPESVSPDYFAAYTGKIEIFTSLGIRVNHKLKKDDPLERIRTFTIMMTGAPNTLDPNGPEIEPFSGQLLSGITMASTLDEVTNALRAAGKRPAVNVSAEAATVGETDIGDTLVTLGRKRYTTHFIFDGQTHFMKRAVVRCR